MQSYYQYTHPASRWAVRSKRAWLKRSGTRPTKGRWLSSCFLRVDGKRKSRERKAVKVARGRNSGIKLVVGKETADWKRTEYAR